MMMPANIAVVTLAWVVTTIRRMAVQMVTIRVVQFALMIVTQAVLGSCPAAAAVDSAQSQAKGRTGKISMIEPRHKTRM
jgi:hypothetical protein